MRQLNRLKQQRLKQWAVQQWLQQQRSVRQRLEWLQQWTVGQRQPQ